MLINFLFFILARANYYLPPENDELSTQTCGKYQCTPTTISIPSASCGTVTNIDTFNLQICANPSSVPYCNTTTLECTAIPNLAPLQSYPGEPCIAQSDCLYGTCTSQICVGQGVNGACTSHAMCAPGYRCSNGGTCQAQIAIGVTGCRDYHDCVNWGGCNSTYSSSNGTCIQYATVNNGELVTDCISGYSNLCKTGFCKKSQGWFSNIGTCSKAPYSSSTTPMSCTVDTDCKGSDGTNIYLSKCVCGYNSAGTSYCMPFIGDAVGILLISTLTTALKSAGVCNTGRRSTKECMKLLNKESSTTSVIYGFDYYPLTINNDACVKQIYTPEYWQLVISSGVISKYAMIYFVIEFFI